MGHNRIRRQRETFAYRFAAATDYSDGWQPRGWWDHPSMNEESRDAFERADRRNNPHLYEEQEPDPNATAHYYHITDKPDFALDPGYHPQDMWGDGDLRPGVYLSKNPRTWRDNYSWGGKRPYTVEFEGPADLHTRPLVGQPIPWDDQHLDDELYVPSSMFHLLKQKRIIFNKPAKQANSAYRLAAEFDPREVTDRIGGEFRDWASQNEHRLHPTTPYPPHRDWRNIEMFLKDNYPAAHKGFSKGQEQAGVMLDYPQKGKRYKTGPRTQEALGYDPKEIAAGALYLHNSSHPFRMEWSNDLDRLTRIYDNRQRMQRNYEQRQANSYRYATDSYLKPDDWEEPAKGGPQTLYRGLIVPSPVDLEGLTKSVGRNWTTDEDRAGFFSDPLDYQDVPNIDTNGYRGGEGPFVGVHLEGEWDGDPDSIDHDWQRIHYDEDEVRLKPGTPINVTNMHYVYPEGGWDDENALDGPKQFHAYRLAAVNQEDFISGLSNEFNQWHSEQPDRDEWPTWRGINHWPNIEKFLKERYPATHRDFGMGIEEARPLIRQEDNPFYEMYPNEEWRYSPEEYKSLPPYESGPKAESKYGYDPRAVAAGMILLHNRGNGGDASRELEIDDDTDLLNDIFNKRMDMQRNYEQRQANSRIAMPQMYRGLGLRKSDFPPELVGRIESYLGGEPDDNLYNDLLDHLDRGGEGLGSWWSRDKNVASDYVRDGFGPRNYDYEVMLGADWDGKGGYSPLTNDDRVFEDDHVNAAIRPGHGMQMGEIGLRPRGGDWVTVPGSSGRWASTVKKIRPR